MNMTKKYWIFMVIICLLFVASSSFAQGPDSRPHGWDKGEKKGWDSDTPPGLEKKNEIDNDSEDSSGDDVSSDDSSSDEESGDDDKKKDKKKHKKKKEK